MEPFGLHATLPITATDDEIRATLTEAEIPPLLPALAYLTGDRTLLRDDLRPDPALLALPQGGLTDEQQHVARDLALDVIVQFRDGGCRPSPPPTPDELLQIVEHVVGGSGMDDYLPLLEEELALRGEDRRAPRWSKAELAPAVDFRVVVIGAGMSGLLTAHRLAQAGVEYVVVEKNPDVGGTWYENRYPGCRVDNPNHNYSYSFAQRHDWPLHFSTQDVLLDYFRGCAHDFGVLEHIRFDTEVVSATWSDTDATWSVVVRTAGSHGEGREETIVAQAVVSAVGQLNRPRFPDIPGRETFAGPSFHSAQWDPDVGLDGKRVAVIGTGASSVQFTPEIAPAPRTSSCSSAPPRGWVRRRTTTSRYRPACAGCTRTSRCTASGTASGCSGAWATARSPACASIRRGTPHTVRSVR